MLPPYSTDARNGRSGRSGAAALQRAAGAPKRGLGEYFLSCLFTAQ